PQTQVTQNIISSYLTGSRFIELKTVQKLDALEIPKPCIDMTDEGFNTEWSTELTLGQAWEEYTKAWILLHFLERLFNLGVPELERSFVFNISVGYDLEGIKTPKMQRYLKGMKDSGSEERFQLWLTELSRRITDPEFLEGTGLENRREALAGLASDIPGTIVHNVSISTMHGCPPTEIESICRYMLDEQGLDTFVKLNPTLLGYDKVRGILDNLGFRNVHLNPDTFSNDLQWKDAREMLGRLETFSREKGRRFGVKLTNTLASINNREELPGDEMYMSGRSLYPITATVASLVSSAFKGRIPISYSGGVTIHTAEGLLATGIRPLTLCSDMLKPGGYRRQKQIAEALETASGWNLPSIDVVALKDLAEAAVSEKSALKSFRGSDEVKHFGELPLTNCYVAPCVSACAIEQHIPEYIRLVGEKRYADALALIYERNALPSITGTICDHQCQIHCTRQDYEGPVNIREIKLMAVEKGMDEWRKRWSAPVKRPGPKVAVVGAGPAGLSAAFFLARSGVPVTVFEKEPDAGGVVRYVVPHFRISREAIDSDIDVIKAMGAEFRFNQKDITVAGLKAAGYEKVILGIGTWNSPKLPVQGDNPNVIPATKFLYDFNQDKYPKDIGKTVVTVGAGDTSMDAARSALRVPGVKESWILYRRSFEQMPASQEEYEDAVADGVKFAWLRNPERFDTDGTLTAQVMELGEKDDSGRRRPVATGKTEEWKVGTVLYAIGDRPDSDNYATLGVKADERGRVVNDSTQMTEEDGVYLAGDGRTGPATIVKCIADGHRAADSVIASADPDWKYDESVPSWPDAQRKEDIRKKKSTITMSLERPFDRINPEPFAAAESSRCLECNYICDKCADVCPNRANVAFQVDIAAEPLFSDPGQIVHLDAYCNECGNCGHFCPWTIGVPYRDKPTVFSTKVDFENSTNSGWLLQGNTLVWRLGDA
ncbi:MAG: putative selenate reductase subunit YgfK, partial [Spirochaetaceae bacterium]|nr:putative selenate reductase subunit YgfK [Spirochaetaceae bacterium]